LQTALSLVLMAGLDVDLIVQKLAIGPREILNIDIPVIREGEPANFVLFDTDAEWEYNNKNNRSKSYNSPFMGQNLKGKVLLTFNNNQVYK
jgi:dihydroorotase